MKSLINVGLSLLLICFASIGRADSIDDSVAKEMRRQQIPGLAVAVFKDGKLSKVKTYGVSNLELNTPVKSQTVFKIGSLSKQFIAAAALLLKDEGRLKLDDPITKYLDGAPAAWDAITIKHVLSHTSGLPRESPGFDLSKRQTDAEVIKAAYKVAFHFQPGERFEYCNLGYFILAEIIRKASGIPWQDFVRERIFQPLGMTATQVTDDVGIVRERASGYAIVDGRLQHSINSIAVRPSGAFMSTIDDLIKWNRALDARKVLSASTWDQAWLPVTLNDGTMAPYGYGWFVEESGPYHVVHHSGAIYGFTSQYSRFDQQHLRIIVLANLDASRTDLIALRIAEQFLPGVLLRHRPITLPPEKLASLAGKFDYGTLGIATVDVDGSALRWHLPAAGAPVRFIPESEIAFYSEDDPRQILELVTNDQGQPLAILTNSGREIARGRKIAAN